MNKLLTLNKRVDSYLMTTQDNDFREHLGASIIGHECSRYIWLTFHWAKRHTVGGRVASLFERGHREEARFVEKLRGAGVVVHDVATDGKQYRVRWGHFGGSEDAQLEKVPGLKSGRRYLGEFKTHNDKSFRHILKHGVKKSKPEHYDQCQTYLKLDKILRGAVYVSLNKNDDAMYYEFIPRDKHRGTYLLRKAKNIIDSPVPLGRLSADPRFWRCTFCHFHGICHGAEVPLVNCRTCARSTPVLTAKGAPVWRCHYWNRLFPASAGTAPCRAHVFNPYMLNGVTVLNGKRGDDFFRLRLPNGEEIKHGADYVRSENIKLNVEG